MYKVWVKPNGEMPFLYGNHVLKAHVGRITQDTPEHQGVVVYSMSDIPLVYGLKKLIYLGIWSYGEVNYGFEKVGAYCDSGISSRGCGCLFTGGGYHVLVGYLIAVFNCGSTIMVSNCDVVTSLGQMSNTATTHYSFLGPIPHPKTLLPANSSITLVVDGFLFANSSVDRRKEDLRRRE
jgi:UPF0113 PUA domain